MATLLRSSLKDRRHRRNFYSMRQFPLHTCIRFYEHFPAYTTLVEQFYTCQEKCCFQGSTRETGLKAFRRSNLLLMEISFPSHFSLSFFLRISSPFLNEKKKKKRKSQHLHFRVIEVRSNWPRYFRSFVQFPGIFFFAPFYLTLLSYSSIFPPPSLLGSIGFRHNGRDHKISRAASLVSRCLDACPRAPTFPVDQLSSIPSSPLRGSFLLNLAGFNKRHVADQ